jgi:uncharacterized membrane protein YbhN (UPF0104 family)
MHDKGLDGASSTTTPRRLFYRRLVTYGRYAIGIAILALLIKTVDLPGGWTTILDGNGVLCGVAFLLFGLSRSSEALRLYYLVPEREISVSQALQIILVSTFFNNFTAMVVGDGYRVVATRNILKNWERSLAIIVLDRLLGVFAIVFLGTVYIPFIYDRFYDVMQTFEINLPALGSYLRIIVVLLLLFGVMITITVFRRMRLGERLRKSGDIIREIGARNWALATMWSVVSQLLVAGMTLSLVHAYGGQLGFADTVFVMLIVFGASYLPISVGSLGVREGSLVIGLVGYGVAEPVALSSAIVARIMIYSYALAGGAWLFFFRKSTPPVGEDM